MSENSIAEQTGNQGLVSLAGWLEQMGVTPCTGWRWRKRGWLKVVNICGRLYISRAAREEFQQRAERGEFALDHAVPQRTGRAA